MNKLDSKVDLHNFLFNHEHAWSLPTKPIVTYNFTIFHNAIIHTLMVVLRYCEYWHLICIPLK